MAAPPSLVHCFPITFVRGNPFFALRLPSSFADNETSRGVTVFKDREAS